MVVSPNGWVIMFVQMLTFHSAFGNFRSAAEVSLPLFFVSSLNFCNVNFLVHGGFNNIPSIVYSFITACHATSAEQGLRNKIGDMMSPCSTSLWPFCEA